MTLEDYHGLGITDYYFALHVPAGYPATFGHLLYSSLCYYALATHARRACWMDYLQMLLRLTKHKKSTRKLVGFSLYH